jgi:hypothetical protein
MPNANVHRPVGAAVGAGFAYHQARNFPIGQMLPELLGGAAGGLLGAALPDWGDPATTPNHRHIWHGAGSVAGAVWISGQTILRLQRRLRNRANALLANRCYLNDDLQRLLSMIEEFFLRFLAGLLNGVAGGYISHLFLDALTARSIPLFARGC